MKITYIITSFFLTCITLFVFPGCTSTTGCGGSSGPYIEKSKSFVDSMKIPLSFDPIFLFIRSRSFNYPDTSNYEVIQSDLLQDSILIRVNMRGQYLSGDSLRPSKSSVWMHDSVTLNFDYLTNSTQQNNIPTKIAIKGDTIQCTPAPETFLITHSVIVIPKNKSVDSIRYLSWKIK